jgi:hypothetical protein
VNVPFPHSSSFLSVLAMLQDKGSARIASQVLAALAHLAPDIVLVGGWVLKGRPEGQHRRRLGRLLQSCTLHQQLR